MSLHSSLFRADLHVDLLSHYAALSLPKAAIAILPFIRRDGPGSNPSKVRFHHSTNHWRIAADYAQGCAL
jgi:hypothetical protein